MKHNYYRVECFSVANNCFCSFSLYMNEEDAVLNMQVMSKSWPGLWRVIHEGKIINQIDSKIPVKIIDLELLLKETRKEIDANR